MAIYSVFFSILAHSAIVFLPPFQMWLHAAKAIRADHEGKRSLQAFHLLKCQSWNASHEVLLKHLASKAVVNGTGFISSIGTTEGATHYGPAYTRI